MLVPVNTSIRYPLFLILILSILVSILVSIGATTPSVSAILNSSNSSNYSYNHYDDVISHQNNSIDRYETWSLGNNIQKGDYYEYKICNDYHIAQMIYPYHCYQINLEFVTILESYKGKVWVVQGNFTILGTILGTTLDTILGTTPHTSQQMIFLIDSTNFKVDTDILHKDIGVSLENTIFSLSQYGVQSLSIGTIWDYMDSYFTNKIPLEIKNKQTIQVPQTGINGTIVTNIVNNTVTNVVTSIVTNIETSVLSYDVIVPSNIYLHESFPFPLKAVTYSPHIIYPQPKEEYYFELLDYSNYYSNTFGYPSGYQLDDSPDILTEDEK